MKVVTVANVPPNKMGSFEKYLRDHSYHLLKSGFSHTIFLPNKPIPEVCTSLESEGAKVVVFENLHKNDLRARWKLYREILKEQPTVLHTHFIHILGPLSFLMLFNKVKFFATYHISGALANSNWLVRFYKRLRWLMLGSSYDGIFCVSEYTKKKFVNNYGAFRHNVSVVYNAINQSEFGEYRDKYSTRSFSGDKLIRLVTVSALIPDKGIQYLIEACSQLSSRSIDYQLHIIGEGPYRKNLEELVKIYGINEEVHFLGSRNDVPNLLMNGDIMIVPSIWQEAFGFTILEAMSIGVPLIVTNVGAIPELVENNFNGLVVEKESADQISEAVIKLTESPKLRKNFSDRGISISNTRFSIDNQCEKLIFLYGVSKKNSG
ncbi:MULTISPECIES: glycosyltransferase family 4 protein [unclassified Marinobacter]|jgi:glycosyltransferase involved in cell wall biosynthesis|uniref:glycosyltransferase family 4 protein n=1 Tax=unclassified Marinobacter TaxID=83889 RepID=UPI00094B0111|nr:MULTISPECIES: glycosyltransferase family 4 protein [unclassified Marinobacter]